METVKQYIYIDKMYEAVLEILKDSRNGMTQDWSRGFMEDNYPDGELEDRAQVMAENNRNRPMLTGNGWWTGSSRHSARSA